MGFQRIWGRPAGPAAGLAVALFAASCAPEAVPGKLGPVEGFAGLVAADEPRAAVVGREVLGNGGTAIDAAVAMYFTMAVTMPSRVGLGGGGVCVMFDRAQKRAEAIEFLPRAAPSGGIVPAGTRAMAALHARSGSVRWEQLLVPAENLARFGHTVSRAFARDLAAGASIIKAKPELREIFTARSGRLATTGEKIVQPELSTVLSGIRRQGAAYVHGGTFAARLAEASSAAGMPLSVEDIRASLPRLVEAVSVPALKRDVAYFSPPRASAGIVAAQIWGALTRVRDYEGADEGERDHLFVETVQRAFSQRAAWARPDGSSAEPLEALVEEARLERIMAGYDPARHTPAAALQPAPENISIQSPSAGFVAADQFTKAIACNFTLNRLFGAGRVAPGTGVILAAPPRSQTDGSTSIAAVVIGNTATGDVRFAGVGGIGPLGTTALARMMLDTVIREETLDAVMSRPRLHTHGAPDVLLHELDVPQEARAALIERGHELRIVPAIGQVNAIYCPLGLKDHPEDCEVASDPRGHGLAQVAQ